MSREEIKHFGTRPLSERRRTQKNGFSWIFIIIIFIGGGIYWLNTINPIEVPEEEVLQNNDEAVNYFTETIQNKFITLVGQPIEGFEPTMFMQIYPGLLSEDFDGVEAMQGVYRVDGGEIFFDESFNEPPHSAGRALSEKGMLRLFDNVMNRRGITSPTKDSVDQVLLFLEGRPEIESSSTTNNEEKKALDTLL